MRVQQNSPFLVALLRKARTVMMKNHGKVLSVEYLTVAALQYCLENPGKEWKTALSPEMLAECQAMEKVLLEPFPEPQVTVDRILYMLAGGTGQSDQCLDGIALQRLLFSAGEVAGKKGLSVVTADILFTCILSDPAQRLLNFLNKNDGGDTIEPILTDTDGRVDPKETTIAIHNEIDARDIPEQKPVSSGKSSEIGRIMNKTNQVRDALLKNLFGQDHAVSTFTSGYFQAEMDRLTRSDSSKPTATFLFAGPPGVGKTFLAETAAKAMDLPFRRFDMSEYCEKEANLMFAGSDKVYRDSHPGAVTDFVNAFPRSVLLFDEIEKAHMVVIHLFLQILDAGRLRDNCTGKEVSFANTVIIFTTNAGRSLYADSDTGNFSTLPRKTILRALETDINPLTKEPFFPAAICSRFATGNVVMFNQMGAHDLRRITQRSIMKQAQSYHNALNIEFTFDSSVFSAVLLGEGSTADARTITARAKHFFDNEIFELMSLINSRSGGSTANNFRKVHFCINLDDEKPEVRSLFRSDKKFQVLIFGDPGDFAGIRLPDTADYHYAQTFPQAREILRTRDIQVALCDIRHGQEDAQLFLNVEDTDSQGRTFFRYMVQNRPATPIYLLEDPEKSFHTEERLSLIRDGARGIVDLRREDLSTLFDILHQQQSMLALGRASKVLRYETAQWLSPDGQEARIRLLDMRLETAVDASDKDAVVSIIPNVTFDQVIGAADAKSELQYFVNYMRDPKRYAFIGIREPKGVLLYGPPGTGKTMLAKAMAREAGAAFIAVEGNQFLQPQLGSGSELVHSIFRKARKYAPSILFIDEIDAIARARTGHGHSEDTLTAFLAEMDGFRTDRSKPVFVLAATNFDPEPGSSTSLDPALMRRFDRRVLVDLPDRQARELFLRRKAQDNPAICLTEEYISNIAVRTTGMSLALLESVVDLALRCAIRANVTQVDGKLFDEALELFTNGEEKGWDPAHLLMTARHEAGHALVCWKSGETPSYLTIVARGSHGGYMRHGDAENKSTYTRRELLDRIRCSLAGRAAEVVCCGSEDGVDTGASSDLRHATATATRMLCSYGMDEEFGLATVSQSAREDGPLALEIRAQVNRILNRQMEEAMAIIRENRKGLDALVEVLLQRNYLTGPEIDRILKENT